MYGINKLTILFSRNRVNIRYENTLDACYELEGRRIDFCSIGIDTFKEQNGIIKVLMFVEDNV